MRSTSRPFDFPTGERSGRGVARRLDYAAVLAVYNAGRSLKQTAVFFHCKPASVQRVLGLARLAGVTVRSQHHRCLRGHRMERERSGALRCPTCRQARMAKAREGPSGRSGCLTCRRDVTPNDRARQNHLLPDVECCAWCGRRYDGVIRMPKRIWTWLKATLETVDAP